MKNIKKGAEETLLCVLEAIDRKDKLTPELSPEEKKIQRLTIEKLRSAEEGITEDWYSAEKKRFALLEDKKIRISLADAKNCSILSVVDLKDILGVLRQRKFISEFCPSSGTHDCFDMVLPKNFDKYFKEFKRGLGEEDLTNCKLLFDKDKSILMVGDVPVKIRKHTNQYYLLSTIFENEETKLKDWQFSEMTENWNSPLSGFSDKRIHNIATALKIKIAGETKNKDILKTTTHSIKINKEYL